MDRRKFLVSPQLFTYSSYKKQYHLSQKWCADHFLSFIPANSWPRNSPDCAITFAPKKWTKLYHFVENFKRYLLIKEILTEKHSKHSSGIYYTTSVINKIHSAAIKIKESTCRLLTTSLQCYCFVGLWKKPNRSP